MITSPLVTDFFFSHPLDLTSLLHGEAKLTASKNDVKISGCNNFRMLSFWMLVVLDVITFVEVVVFVIILYYLLDFLIFVNIFVFSF
jgi:hypothetical protein